MLSVLLCSPSHGLQICAIIVSTQQLFFYSGKIVFTKTIHRTKKRLIPQLSLPKGALIKIISDQYNQGDRLLFGNYIFIINFKSMALNKDYSCIFFVKYLLLSFQMIYSLTSQIECTKCYSSFSETLDIFKNNTLQFVKTLKVIT